MGFKDRKKKRELTAVMERGKDLFMEEPGQESFEFLEDAVKRFPNDAELRLLFASIHLEFQPQLVASQAAKAAELGADDAGIQVRAGHLMFDRGEVEGARACARRANELAGPDFVLISGLESLDGRIAAVDGRYVLAEAKLRSAAEREPAFSSFAFHLAKFLAARDRQAEALVVIDESLERANDKDDLKRLRNEIAGDAAG
jgi:tetratricopeptide (TPR) repeat protein